MTHQILIMMGKQHIQNLFVRGCPANSSRAISGILSCGDFSASSFAPRRLQTLKMLPKCRLSFKPYSEFIPACSNHSLSLRDCKMAQLGTRLGEFSSKSACSWSKTFSPGHQFHHIYPTVRENFMFSSPISSITFALVTTVCLLKICSCWSTIVGKC